MAFFVAFYSYKGGVGRTLALANVGYSLARRGKRVVLIDMDLEAPALLGFPEFTLNGKSPKKGFIEYAASYSRRGSCPSIKGHVHACRDSPGTGELWVMPSGRVDASYQKTLGELSWRRLHPKKGTPPLAEELRSALEKELDPDYVLIDSRTGFSDVGGLSTHLLSDMIVLVFNLTRECIEGSIWAYNAFVLEEVGVETLQLVASPIPPVVPSENSLVESRIRQAKEQMPQGCVAGRDVVRILYDPSMVLSEELAVRRSEVYAAAEKYESLREAIQRSNRGEVFSAVEEARRRRSEGRWTEGLRRLQEFVEENSDDIEGYMELGGFLLEGDRPEEARSAFEQATRLDGNLALAHRRLGEASLAARRFREAVESLEKSRELGNESQGTLNALARAYAEMEDAPRYDRPADLEIRITTEIVGGGTRLSYILHSDTGAVGFTHYKVGYVTIRGRPEDYQIRLLSTVQKLTHRIASDDTLLSSGEVEDELVSLGHELYKTLFPPELRNAYRNFRDRIKTLLILSEDPSIPWELVKPYDSRMGEVIIDDDFLCCRFELTRWLIGKIAPSTEIWVPRVVSIEISRPPDVQPLRYASRESKVLATLAKGHSNVQYLASSDATYAEVEQILRNGGNGVLHFVSHGELDLEAPNESRLLLADGRSLRPRDLHGVIESQLQRDRPLVFLNIGSPISAWASRWILDGCCGGLVGPQWSIGDRSSFLFAKIFYESLEQGETLGQAARTARIRVREEFPESTTWLAYAIYAHPNARLRLGEESTGRS